MHLRVKPNIELRRKVWHVNILNMLLLAEFVSFKRLLSYDGYAVLLICIE